ncbi:N-methyl-L-tryptophan oxidase [Mycolicibacterium stellerae]|uniref:N-methyl-L-tryptophan oxidase n=1 Tax=Mycolicibacterium stellerae TaxID=2358193 RepID=UPI0013DE1DDE|nr:N-methyl-L-tryptophan oxidase [Mycolicibacterium stellerae]
MCDLAVIGLGALGSSTAWHAASRGLRVVGLEAFEFGHDRGASHDTSRIIRHSYHTPAYVALTFGAYDDWARLEDQTGEHFVTVTGGLDLYPHDAAIPAADYTSSMDAHDIAYDVLDADAVGERWPAFDLPDGTIAIHQARTGIVPAARGTAAMARRATELGAVLHYNTRVEALVPRADGVDLITADNVISAGCVVVTADAWTADLLAPLGVDLPLTVTEEQVTYFAPGRPAEFSPDVFPVWIWMDEPSYYGFPTYGEDTIKAAQDCGGPIVTGDDRSGAPDEVMRERLSGFMRRVVPRCGPPVRSKRCLYTLTPDRDFVIDRLPGHPSVTVGLGAGHGFKFAALFGRLLTDVAVDGESRYDLSAFRLDRPALTDPSYEANWMV